MNASDESVAPVVGATAGVFARDPWTPQQNVGVLCAGRRARRHGAPAAGRGGARRRQRGQDAQHRTPSVPLSGQSADHRGPALDSPHRPLPRLLARSTPGFRARRDHAGRARDRVVSGAGGPFAPVAGELAGPAGTREMGTAAMGGGRRAAGPRHSPPGSGRLHAAGRSRTGRASAGPAVRAARLALHPARVRRAHLPAPARALGADVDPCRRLVPQRGRQWYGAVQLWQERPLAAQVSATWEPGQKEPWIVLSDRPAGRQRVREYARRMRVESTFQDLKRRGWDLEGTVIADRARLDRLLLVRVSRPLVAGALGGLVCPSWAARSVRSPRSPRQGHLSPRAALVARYPATDGHRNEPHTVLALPKNPHGMGVSPSASKKCQGERTRRPRRSRRCWPGGVSSWAC